MPIVYKTKVIGQPYVDETPTIEALEHNIQRLMGEREIAGLGERVIRCLAYGMAMELETLLDRRRRGDFR